MSAGGSRYALYHSTQTLRSKYECGAVEYDFLKIRCRAAENFMAKYFASDQVSGLE